MFSSVSLSASPKHTRAIAGGHDALKGRQIGRVPLVVRVGRGHNDVRAGRRRAVVQKRLEVGGVGLQVRHGVGDPAGGGEGVRATGHRAGHGAIHHDGVELEDDRRVGGGARDDAAQRREDAGEGG